MAKSGFRERVGFWWAFRERGRIVFADGFWDGIEELGFREQDSESTDFGFHDEHCAWPDCVSGISAGWTRADRMLWRCPLP